MSIVLALAALVAAAASVVTKRSWRRWVVCAWGESGEEARRVAGCSAHMGGAGRRCLGGAGRRCLGGACSAGGYGSGIWGGDCSERGILGRDCSERGRGLRIKASGSGAARAKILRSRKPSGPADYRIAGAELALLVTEVASRLRAGAPVEHAWEASWTRLIPGVPFSGIDEDGSPRVLSELTKVPALTQIRTFSDIRRIHWLKRGRGRAAHSATLALRSACRLSASSGAPLAQILDAVADGLEESEAAEEARRIASSSARTSSRILIALPLLGIIGAQVMGADPIGTFSDAGIGSVLGLIGLTLLLASIFVSRTLIARAAGSAGELDPAIACDLAQAVLEAGGSIPQVLEAIGESAEEPTLRAAGRGLRIGLKWSRAWEERPNDPLALALEPAWTDGAMPDELLRRSARAIRVGRIADARAKAEALGVELALPLGALLLPAFLALGLGPVMLHLFEGGFASLV